MFKAIFRKNFLLVFALAFGIICLILPNNIFSTIKYRNLINNGIQTEAKVVPDSADVKVTVNGRDVCSFKYVFNDENGNAHTGESSASYTDSQIFSFEQQGSIMISYNPKTFDSIESDYFEYNSFSGLSFFVIIFGIIDIFCWIFAIRRIIRNIKHYNIIKNGLPAKATVINVIDTSTSINNERLCKVQYSWTDELGNARETTTAADYFIDQADALFAQKIIDIKIWKGKSTIVSEPDLSYLDPPPHIDEILDNTLESFKQDSTESSNYKQFNNNSDDNPPSTPPQY